MSKYVSQNTIISFKFDSINFFYSRKPLMIDRFFQSLKPVIIDFKNIANYIISPDKRSAFNMWK